MRMQAPCSYRARSLVYLDFSKTHQDSYGLTETQTEGTGIRLRLLCALLVRGEIDICALLA